MKPNASKIDIPHSINFEYKEILTIFTSLNDQKILIEKDVWPDPASWGILLVDLIRHISLSYGGNGDIQTDPFINRIRQGFDAEWETPSDSIL
jgi:Domain of unknown function (DUF5076)